MHPESALEKEPFDVFMAKVWFSESGCWEWTGAKFQDIGYGKAHIGGFTERYAHRLSYLLFIGAIPEGLELDHLCRNRHCVNPDHLEAVPHQVNVRRGMAPLVGGDYQRNKTHCRHGHPYSGDNLYRYPNGERGCRTCHRRNAMRHYYKRRQEVSNAATT